MMGELELEKNILDSKLADILEVLNEEKSSLDKVFKNFIGTREELWRISEDKKVHINSLYASLNRPYFARINFEFKDKKTKSFYIGKHGIIKDGKPVVTDWRAPISSVYYDSELGNCSYLSEGGEIHGKLNLKRQFEIDKGKLLGYFDVDLVSNDELLQKYLNTNNDARLKSIVATIQKEQNAVIRKNLYDNLIIQGVAGSGKTTVALHRIAYLVYNYINEVSQKDYLVIGPNPVFLKYIKPVLPDLDVAGIKECTFEELAKDFIEEDIEINSSSKKVNASIAGKINNDIDKFKSSMTYKMMLTKFINHYFRGITSKDLVIDDFLVLDHNTIENVFASTEDYDLTLSDRIDITIQKLETMLDDMQESIVSKYNSYCSYLFNNMNSDEREKARIKFAKNKEELRKNCHNLLRKYFNKYRLSATKVYKLFINNIEDYNEFGYQNIKELKNSTLKSIKEDKYDFEDLAALMYIKHRINPKKDYLRIKHTVIDEAQDLGEFNFYILRKILHSSTFSIFGDLAQSIYDYRGIDSWERVNQVMFDNCGKIINFGKSYRTTAEIMDVADTVAESIGMVKSDIVVRHGNKVEFSYQEKEDDIPGYIALKIKEYQNKGYKTIAIISKTDLLSRYMNDDLSFKRVIIPNATEDSDLTDEKYNICTISNQLAKGLEFDAVIINNANEDLYNSTNPLDMKLLYVAITRALHEVDITYSKELTKPLKEYLNRQNDTKLIRRK